MKGKFNKVKEFFYNHKKQFASVGACALCIGLTVGKTFADGTTGGTTDADTASVQSAITAGIGGFKTLLLWGIVAAAGAGFSIWGLIQGIKVVPGFIKGFIKK
jgi:hypothetical protein